MTKKRSSDIFGVKMEIFSVIQKSWCAKKISSPQTRRQVSATGWMDGWIVGLCVNLMGNQKIVLNFFNERFGPILSARNGTILSNKFHYSFCWVASPAIELLNGMDSYWYNAQIILQ